MIAILRSPARSRRGMLLVYVVCLIPIAIFLLLESLTQMEIRIRETHRAQARLQARLLAESALTLWKAGATAGETREAIPGAGVMILEIQESGATPNVTARGLVFDGPNEYDCEISAAAPPGAAKLALLGSVASQRPSPEPATLLPPAP